MRCLFLAGLILFLSCTESSDEVAKEKSVIHIAVAANLSFVILELSKEFERENPETDIQISLGSSGKLSAQIQNKAPYDIFMSANREYPEKLFGLGIGLEKPKIYANGDLVFISMGEKDFSAGLKILESEKFQTIAIANPKTAPYGFASFEVLNNLGYLENLKSSFIFGESIGQTATYVSKVTKIGFIAKSQLYGDGFSNLIEGKDWIEVPKNLYSPISQGVLILNEKGRGFYNFLLSEKGKTVLSNFGYSF